MKKYFPFTIIGLLFGLALFISFQIPTTNNTDSVFINPIDIPLYMSGNFGEPRGDHFHTGIDFSTRGKTGIAVKSIADGYVSRIKVQAGGYGHALYIMHPNGFMSVYGHLSKYNEAIEKYVREQQYLKKSFEVDLYPEKNLFPLKQGEIIALSGNTGTSTAPHLHFEIRDASGESFPLNPLQWISIKDFISPTINSLVVYPVSLTAPSNEKKTFALIKKGNEYSVSQTIIFNKQYLSFGIRATDFADNNDADGDFGIYSIHSTIDGKPFYGFKLDRLDFSEGRYVNAHIDFAEKKNTGVLVYRNFLLPGNNAGIYYDCNNRGIINLTDTISHKVEVIVKDYAGNKSVLRFNIKKSLSIKKDIETSLKKEEKLFKWNEENNYTEDSIKINFPDGVFYNDLKFQCRKTNSTDTQKLSAVYTCGDPFTPLHSYCTIQIIPKKLSESLRSKAVICVRNYKGEVSAKTSKWNGAYLITKIREFGEFYVSVDTTKPTVSFINIQNNETLVADNIKIKIADNLSGIVQYNGYIDDEWVLFEFDFKSKTLTWKNDNKLNKGEHTLKLVVADEVANVKTTTIKFKI